MQFEMVPNFSYFWTGGGNPIYDKPGEFSQGAPSLSMQMNIDKHIISNGLDKRIAQEMKKIGAKYGYRISVTIYEMG